MSVEQARRQFIQNDYAGAIDTLESIISGAVSSTEVDIFDAQCVRASISCLVSPDGAYVKAMATRTGEEHNVKSFLLAMLLLQQGLVESAILKLQTILREDPHFVAAHLGLGAAHFKKGDYAEAFQHYSDVLERGGSTVPSVTRVGLGLCAMRQGKYDHALRCFQQALAVQPLDELALKAKIVVDLHFRNIKDVAESVMRLHQVAPQSSIVMQKFTDLLYFKSLTAGRLAELCDSIRSLVLEAVAHEIGTARDVRESRAYSAFQLGRLAHFEGKLDIAEQHYKDAIEVLKFSCRAAHLYLAKVYAASGNEGRCREVLTGLLESTTDKEAFYMATSQHLRSSNHVRAMYYANILATDYALSDPTAWWLYGFAARHNPQRAADLVDTIRSLPGAAMHWKAQTAHATLAQSPQDLKDLLAQEGSIGEGSTAADITVRLQANPSLLPLVYNVALAHLSSQRSFSRTLLVAVVKVFPAFVDAYHRMAELFIHERRFAAAQKWLALAGRACSDGSAVVAAARMFSDAGNVKAAVDLLRVPNAGDQATLALGCIYLDAAQRPTERAGMHLLGAKECFSSVLRKDTANALAASGLACCVSIGGGHASKRARHELVANSLATVSSVPLNDGRAQEGATENMINLWARSHAHKRVIDLYATHPPTTVQASSTFAYSLAHEGDFSGALGALEKGLAMEPAAPALLYNRILLLFAIITKGLSAERTLSIEQGRRVRKYLEQASVEARTFVSRSPSDSGLMTRQALEEAQRNVRAVARQLPQLEECLQECVRRGAAEFKHFGKRREEWKETAASAAKIEAQNKIMRQQTIDALNAEKMRKSSENYKNMRAVMTTHDELIEGDFSADPEAANGHIDNALVDALAGNIPEML